VRLAGLKPAGGPTPKIKKRRGNYGALFGAGSLAGRIGGAVYVYFVIWHRIQTAAVQALPREEGDRRQPTRSRTFPRAHARDGLVGNGALLADFGEVLSVACVFFFSEQGAHYSDLERFVGRSAQEAMDSDSREPDGHRAGTGFFFFFSHGKQVRGTAVLPAKFSHRRLAKMLAGWGVRQLQAKRSRRFFGPMTSGGLQCDFWGRDPPVNPCVAIVFLTLAAGGQPDQDKVGAAAPSTLGRYTRRGAKAEAGQDYLPTGVIFNGVGSAARGGLLRFEI